MKHSKPIFGIHVDPHHGGALLAILVEPTLISCGHIAVFTINRDGTTRCVDCDTKYVEKRDGG